MAYVIKDRVLETTTTTGTGTLTLAGAVTGYRTFGDVGNGNTCPYLVFAVDGSGNPTGDWEVGIGTYTTSGTTLARTTVLRSTNSDAAVSFAAGTKRVALALSAADIPILSLGNTFTAAQTVSLNNATTNAVDTLLTLGHNSTGTPAANFGAGVLFTLESSTTADQNAGRVAAYWSTATHASRKSALVLSVWDGSTQRDNVIVATDALYGYIGGVEAFRFDAAGTVPASTMASLTCNAAYLHNGMLIYYTSNPHFYFAAPSDLPVCVMSRYGLFQWTNSTTTVFTTVDVALGREAAGILQVTSGGYPLVGNPARLSVGSASGTQIARVGGVIKDFGAGTGNTGGGEDDIQTYTIPANTLSVDKDKLRAILNLSITAVGGETSQVKIYFAGTVIYDTTALTVGVNKYWTFRVDIIRTGSTTAKAIVQFTDSNTGGIGITRTALTGLDFTTTNVFKSTGTQAGGGPTSGSILDDAGFLEWLPAAA